MTFHRVYSGLSIAIAIVIGVVFIPLRSRASPSWDVWVTDKNGRPVAGVTVRLTFQNYSAEPEPHEIDAITDAQGHVRFSAQTVNASVGRHIATVLSSAMAGVHASFGPYASISAFGNGLEGVAIDERKNVVVDWTGKPDHMHSRIVITRRPASYTGVSH